MCYAARQKSSTVLVVSDGRAGHQRICLGITCALAKLSSVDTFWLPIAEITKSSRGSNRALAAIVPFNWFWPRHYRISEDPALTKLPGTALLQLPSGNVDIVVGAGPGAAAATIALARRYRAKSIYFGFPKLGLIREFDALIRPDRVGCSPRGTVFHIRPSEITPIDRAPYDGSGRPLNVSVLVGGDTAHYKWTACDFSDLARLVEHLAKAGNIVSVYNSRRTPIGFFKEMSSQLGRSCNDVSIVDYRFEGLLSNAAAFRADVIFVSVDSLSMVSEAVASGARTVIFSPRTYKPPFRDTIELDYLRANWGTRAIDLGMQPQFADYFWKKVEPSVDAVDKLASELRRLFPNAC